MLNIHLTLSQVFGFLSTIVERDPSVVARTSDGKVGCVYAEQNGHVLTPVCIVGQMFADLGLLRLLLILPSDVNGYSDQHGTCSTYGEFWNSLAEFGITADEDAKHFMREVQSKQDSGFTWGDALSGAVQEYIDVENARLNDEQAALDHKRQVLANTFA